MPWCPKCKLEYRDGYDQCSDCGESLVDSIDGKGQKENEEKKFVLLMDINQREGEVIRSLLEAHGIEVRSQFNEAGAYLDIYMGGSVFGIKLFVKEGQLKEAKEILGSQVEKEEFGEYEEE
ncbi:putative signal transducing protein [Halonatronum saccharophilum]|uniref:putative signal transducing protein n=1 Tax=Halonatronum saccharophilum TaxID=150060 RepID=UPI0004899328|nr:DUF2007 domain-containing protein [Halonatronum saccharophilum]